MPNDERAPPGLGLTVGVAAAAVWTWFVLVVVRWPLPHVAADRLGARLDGTVADTLRIERIASFGVWVGDVATTLVVGGFVFQVLVARPFPLATVWSPARLLRAVAVVGSFACLAAVPLRAAALTGTLRPGGVDPATLHVVLASRFGMGNLLRVAGVLSTACAVPAVPAGPAASAWPGWSAASGAPGRRGGHGRLAEAAGFAGVVLVLGSYGWVGHPQATAASPAGPGPLLVLGQSVHVLAASTWFGGVFLLLLHLRVARLHGAAAAAPARLVARFSAVASAMVVAVVGTGIALAWSQLASLDALTSTAYGRALVAKLVCVGIVLVLGGINHRWLVPRIVARPGPRAWRALHRTLLGEVAVLVGGVLLATSAMTTGGF